jgi:hypothetical protein
MGSVSQTYCDGCGDDIGRATLAEAITITAIGTNGIPTLMYLCTKPEVQQPEKQDFVNAPLYRVKYKGCARNVLKKSVLSRLYADVQELTGDEDEKPFLL